MTALGFLFRKPRLPILIDVGTGLGAAKSWAAFERMFAKLDIADRTAYDVIDVTGQAFIFYPEHMAFSPLTIRKRWTKASIIARYNASRVAGQPEYPATSLGNKSMEKVVTDIAELLAKSGR